MNVNGKVQSSFRCRYQNVGHCRHGQECHYLHATQKCKNSQCENRKCPYRHPRICKFVLSGRKCPFGNDCSYEHELKKEMNSDNKCLEKQIADLKHEIKVKDDKLIECKSREESFRNEVSKLNERLKNDIEIHNKVLKGVDVTLAQHDAKQKSLDVENLTLRKEIKSLKGKIVAQNNELSSNEEEMKKTEETIKLLRETVAEAPRTQNDFSRIKFMYLKAKKELKEKTEILNKEINALRLSKSKTERSSDENTCMKCAFRSTSKSGLKRHITVKHKIGNGLLKCTECETSFENKCELMTHEELEHGFDLQCEYCEFKCNEITKMLNHEGSEHGIQCNQWDCQFTSKGSKYNPSEFKVLTDHTKTMHGFKCNECEDGFKNKEQLNEHIINDHPESEDLSETE